MGFLPWINYFFGEFARMGIPTAYWAAGGNANTWDNGYEFPWIFNRITGEWNTPIVNAVFAAYGRTPGPELPAPPIRFPIELPGPFNDGTFTYWTQNLRATAFSEKMVVEHTGTFDWGFMFERSGGGFHYPYSQFSRGHYRITEEPGRLVFDMRGLPGYLVGFATWEPGSYVRISRIYISRFTETCPETRLRELIAKAQTLLDTTVVSEQQGADIPQNQFWTAPHYRHNLITAMEAAQALLEI
jgi:hypothetical protein